MDQEHDVDQLLADVEAGKPIGEETPATEQPAEAAPAPEPKGFEPPEWAQFDWNGKRIAPDSPDKAKIWMSQGYNYSQRMGELNRQRAEVEKLQKEWGDKVKVYSEIDEYATKNKDWWEHTQKSFAERDAAKAGAPVSPEIQALREELNGLKDFKSQWETERAEQRAKMEDETLGSAIKSTREKFPTIDFDARDASGLSLEQRVIRHAVENNIPTFRAGALDYLSDSLPDLLRAEGREAAAKNAAQAQKAGVIGRTPAPTKGAMNGAQNVRGKSYGDLRDEALRELGIST